MIEAENQNPSSVGETLRSARASKKKTLQYYADRLRIRAFYLEQLEADHHHELPALVYTLGFVRLYANELGLDPAVLVEQFKREFVPVAASFERDSLEQSPSQRTLPFKQMVACLAVLVLLSGAWVIKGYLKTDAPVEVASFQPPAAQDPLADVPAMEGTVDSTQTGALQVEIPRVEESSQHVKTETPMALAPVVEAAESAKEEEPISLSRPVELTQKQKNNLILTATTDSWIEVRNREKEVILSRVVQAGKTCVLPCQEGYTFSTGDAKGVSLELNGKKLKKLSNDQKVIRDISLDPSTLRARLSSENH